MKKYNTATLSNGLRIIHLPSTSKVVYCGIGINAGARQEAMGEDGLAHFCEHTTFKGTQKRSAIQILNSLESVGGDLNAFTNKEDTVFYAAILKDHLNRAVDLLCDIVFCSVYPEEEIRHEVDVICDEIESYNDSPAELIYDEFENMIFQNHPLGHNILGTRARVLSFTGEDARRFTQHYYRPSNAIFFAYGDVDFARMVKRLERCSRRFCIFLCLKQGFHQFHKRTHGLRGLFHIDLNPEFVLAFQGDLHHGEGVQVDVLKGGIHCNGYRLVQLTFFPKNLYDPFKSAVHFDSSNTVIPG